MSFSARDKYHFYFHFFSVKCNSAALSLYSASAAHLLFKAAKVQNRKPITVNRIVIYIGFIYNASKFSTGIGHLLFQITHFPKALPNSSRVYSLPG